MARTKQTARKTTVPTVAKKQLKIKRKKEKIKGKKGSVQISQSQSEQQFAVNTQQFSIRFDDQQKCEKQCVVSEVVKCKQCAAILTSQSKIIQKNEYKKLKANPKLLDNEKQKFLVNFERVWICQFCLSHNEIEKYVPPNIENPCFLLQKMKRQKQKNLTNINQEEKILIFCIDISTSMDFKAATASRLQCVKEAITQEISRMNYQKQNYKVGLVTFGSLVRLVGDGKKFKQYQLQPIHYNSFDAIVDTVSSIHNFTHPLNSIFKDLKKKVQNLQTYGSTALGPGLLASIQLASQGGTGSKVILCTDGQANVGIGGSFSTERQTFYQKAAQFAKKKKVMVNILSLKGDKCNLKELGKLSLETGGCMMKINPANLGTEFTKITQEEVFGSNSQLIIKMNKIFQISNVPADQVSKDFTTCTKDFGNFTAQTELTFQFIVLSKEQAVKKNIDMGLYQQLKVPMQIQLTYTGRDGSKFLQVITDWRQLTNDQNAVYEGANFGLFAASILQRASKSIRQSKLKEAKSVIDGYWSIVNQRFSKTQTKEELEKFSNRVQKLQAVLNSKMQKAGLIKSQKIQPSIQLGGRGGGSGRGRGRGRRRSSVSRSRSNSRQKQKKQKQSHLMESDDQDVCVYEEMRARSRSISPPSKKKKK